MGRYYNRIYDPNNWWAGAFERYRWVGCNSRFSSIGVPVSVLMATQFAIMDSFGEVSDLYNLSKGIVIRVRDLFGRGLSVGDIAAVEPSIPEDVINSAISGELPFPKESSADFIF